MTTRTPVPEKPQLNQRQIEVELLALDLTSCTRCTGTLANIEAAIEAVRQVAAPTGTAIRLHKILIDSELAAEHHRFESSPTIRVAGRDIVFETRENLCDSCTDLCGCDEGTSCRVWSYQGEEFTEAPVGLVVEALLRAIAGTPAPAIAPTSANDGVPENLRRFFAGKSERAGKAAESCCPPTELATCCAPTEKATCCPPAAATCGCA